MTISTDTVESGSSETNSRAQRPVSNAADRQRGKRMFGALISSLGASSKARSRVPKETMEVEKVDESSEQDAWAAQREDNRQRKHAFVENMVLYTETSPCIAYRPKILLEDQEKRLEPSPTV